VAAQRDECGRATRIAHGPVKPSMPQDPECALDDAITTAVPEVGQDRSRGLPNPKLATLLAAYGALQSRTPNEVLSVAEVIALYGLNGVTIDRFTHSSKYVQPP